MRIASPALLTLLLAGAAATTPSAQTFSLPAYAYGRAQHLAQTVPVATVSLVGDVVRLGGARVVQDTYGEPFVLGAATLDLRIPSQPKIVFTMTNDSDAPISLNDVLIYERTLVSAEYLRGVTVGAPFMPMSAAGWGPGDWQGEQLQPGSRLTVEVPLSPFGPAAVRPAGFIVFVGRRLPAADTSADPIGHSPIADSRPAQADRSPAGRAWLGENPLFTRAFLALLSQR